MQTLRVPRNLLPRARSPAVPETRLGSADRQAYDHDMGHFSLVQTLSLFSLLPPSFRHDRNLTVLLLYAGRYLDFLVSELIWETSGGARFRTWPRLEEKHCVCVVVCCVCSGSPGWGWPNLRGPPLSLLALKRPVRRSIGKSKLGGCRRKRKRSRLQADVTSTQYLRGRIGR